MELKEGIILKSTKYQENSKIIYIITKEGLQSLLIKGSSNLKSKNFSISSDLTKIAFDKVKGKGFEIVTTGKVLNNYSVIKQDLSRLNKALEIVEIAYTLSPHIDDYSQFYSFMDAILEKVNESKYYDIIVYVFKLKTLYLLGVGPIFSNCVKCHKREENMIFDFYSGGVCCKEHQNELSVIFSSEVIEEVKFLYLIKMEYLTDEVMGKIPRDNDRDVEKFIDLYYNHYLGYVSNVSKVFKKI